MEMVALPAMLPCTVTTLLLRMAVAMLELELVALTEPFGLDTVTVPDCPTVRLKDSGEMVIGGAVTVTRRDFLPLLSLTVTVVLPALMALTVILGEASAAEATLEFELVMDRLPLMLVTVTVATWPGLIVRDDGESEAACA